jgi:hypothetical protein
MIWSKLFIPTLREVLADAEATSHTLLRRPETGALQVWRRWKLEFNLPERVTV